jgi:hypothetical protein
MIPYSEAFLLGSFLKDRSIILPCILAGAKGVVEEKICYECR